MGLLYALISLAVVLIGMLFIAALWNRYRDLHGVQVTSADYNGTSWDGNPFVPLTKDKVLLEIADYAWLKKCLQNGTITIHPSDTDYAQWNVRGIGGTVQAAPGDMIMPTAFGLIVQKYQPKK